MPVMDGIEATKNIRANRGARASWLARSCTGDSNSGWGSIAGGKQTSQGEIVINTPASTPAKAALYDAMHEAGISKKELALRLGIDEKEVRRMLDAGHGTKLPRIAEAIEVLGRHLHIALA